MNLNNKGFAITAVIYSMIVLFLMMLLLILIMLSSRKIILDKQKTEALNNINGDSEQTIYKETLLNGAYPELYQGLIPITLSSNGVATVADTTKMWYSYENKIWANAIIVDISDLEIKEKYFNSDMTLKSSSIGTIVESADILMYYVWIPRYSYKLWDINGGNSSPFAIEIKFASNKTKVAGNTNNEFLTHPAFTFGNTELNGIWIGKFETTGDITDMTILPNQNSIGGKTISVMYSSARTLEDNSKYGLKSDIVDTHILKNIDWGALVYLSHSNYGTCNNDICSQISLNNTVGSTGCSSGEVSPSSTATTCKNEWNSSGGYTASSNGNITGIYDLSGGKWEYVMGVMSDENNIPIIGTSEFATLPDPKYYDLYLNGTSDLDQTRGIIGDATKETLSISGANNGSWYNDYSKFVYSDNAWFARGGRAGDLANAGLFAYFRHNGGINGNVSFRIAITKE